MVADHVPGDEVSWLKHAFYELQALLYRVFPPMQPGLPSIDADPEWALLEAYTAEHQAWFPAPLLPSEYEESPDLGFLAVAGPYAGYLEAASEGGYQWNLLDLARYEHHPGLYSLGVRVLFRLNPVSRRLETWRIDSELGQTPPGDRAWELAKKIALCAASTHTSLVRHFNWVHLAAGAPLAMATRNSLPPHHPLCRLLWPHTYGTQYSNAIVTKGQMVRGGDFETIFSFTHRGMCDLFERTYPAFTLLVNDPARDATRRGVPDRGYDTPGLGNLIDLFEVMIRHARRYLAAHYGTDTDLRQDEHVQAWLTELDTLTPNGVAAVAGVPATLESLARLIAMLIYMVTVQHEQLGTSLWNYQLWVHRQPARVYRSGRLEPLDVYQRLVNANFNLNVRRTALLEDFSYLALDARGRECFRAFRADLIALQAMMDRAPYALWQIHPRILEANINA